MDAQFHLEKRKCTATIGEEKGVCVWGGSLRSKAFLASRSLANAVQGRTAQLTGKIRWNNKEASLKLLPKISNRCSVSCNGCEPESHFPAYKIFLFE